MIHVKHHFVTCYVLLFGRNVARKLKRDVLLLHDNSPVHKSNVIQAAIQYTGFTELNHPAYFPDISASDYDLFSNVKSCLRDRDFEADDGVIMIVNHYLEGLDC